MAQYLVFSPNDGGGAAANAERVTFVRDGFSWSAFIFGPLWLLRHRLWLALLGYVAVAAALAAAAIYLRVADDAGAPIAILISLLLGLEAPELRRRSLLRRGWRDCGTVTGEDRFAAEQRFFDRWDGDVSVGPVQTAARSPASPAGAGIIGLFPEPGVRR
jgi:hypothetical protein